MVIVVELIFVLVFSNREMILVGLFVREVEIVFSSISVFVIRILAKFRLFVLTLVLFSVTEVSRKLIFMFFIGLSLALVTFVVMVAFSVVLTTNEYIEVKEVSFAVLVSVIKVICFVLLIL